MELTIHTLDTAPAASRPVLEGLAADLGLVPNFAAAIATSPALIAGFDGMRRAVATTSLDPILREVAGLAVGVAVDNHYGVAFHSTVLARLGADEADIEAIRSGGSPTAPDTAAVEALAREVVEQRGKVADETMAAARAAGLSTENVLEVVLECAFASMVGLVDNLAGHITLDQFLAPRAWGASVRAHR